MSQFERDSNVRPTGNQLKLKENLTDGNSASFFSPDFSFKTTQPEYGLLTDEKTIRQSTIFEALVFSPMDDSTLEIPSVLSVENTPIGEDERRRIRREKNRESAVRSRARKNLELSKLKEINSSCRDKLGISPMVNLDGLYENFQQEESNNRGANSRRMDVKEIDDRIRRQKILCARRFRANRVQNEVRLKGENDWLLDLDNSMQDLISTAEIVLGFQINNLIISLNTLNYSNDERLNYINQLKESLTCLKIERLRGMDIQSVPLVPLTDITERKSTVEGFSNTQLTCQEVAFSTGETESGNIIFSLDSSSDQHDTGPGDSYDTLTDLFKFNN